MGVCYGHSTISDCGGTSSTTHRRISLKKVAQSYFDFSVKHTLCMEGSGQVEEQCDEQFTDQVVMVIGGAGFLGQHIIKLLQERADGIKEIQVFDLKPYENKLGMISHV